MTEIHHYGDFSQLKIWRFLLYLIFIYFVSHLVGGIVASVVGIGWLDRALQSIILYSWGFRHVGKALLRSRVEPAQLLRPIPEEFGPRKMAGLLWGALTVNIGLGSFTLALFIACLPQMLHIQIQNLDFTSNLGIVLEFAEIVILAPIFEEFVFRGVVFNWARQRWNAKTAIILSSLIFAFGHTPNLLGPLFVGWTLSLLYHRTGTLTAPILLHMANNLFGWLMGLSGSLQPDTVWLPETSDLSHIVMSGIVLIIAGLGPLIYFAKDSLKQKGANTKG